jgi:hypothetical protein
MSSRTRSRRVRPEKGRRTTRPARRGRLAGVLWLLAAIGLRAGAAEPFGRMEQAALSEYEVKAGFLVNFTKFVEWPPDAFARPDAPLILCLASDDPFGPAIDNLVKGRAIDGRAVLVRRLSRTDQAGTCHLLFVPASEPKHIDQILLAVANKSVLTVGEAADFLHGGGAIRLLVENSRVRFEVNLGAAEAAGLKLSSRLLSLATAVRKDGRH